MSEKQFYSLLITHHSSLLLKYAQHRVVDEAVAGGDGRRVDVEGFAVVVRDAPAGLFDEEDARGHVPGAQALFVEAVEAPRRDVCEVERGSAVAAHGLCRHDEVSEVAREGAALAHVVWEAGAEERAG